MNKFSLGFSIFLNGALKLLLSLIAAVSFVRLFQVSKDFSIINTGYLCGTIFIIACIYCALKKQVQAERILVLVVILAFIIRVLWILSINNSPFSDFDEIYKGAAAYLNGNTDMFKGINYFGRYPHLTIYVLYFAFVQKVTTHSLIAIKIINAIFSTINVVLIYHVCKEVFSSKSKGIWGAAIAALFPPFIIYPATYCSENLAMTFFIASTYVFILVVKKKINSNWLLITGLLLSVGNLFRMVGLVVVVAYLMYVIIYFNSTIWVKVKNGFLILISFLLPLIVVSNMLLAENITEFQLWSGSEPGWTSVLKGTNIGSGGTWTMEDTKIPEGLNYDYELTIKECKRVIKERLTTTPPIKLGIFYLQKFTKQWAVGDVGGLFWAQNGVADKDMTINVERTGKIYIQLFYCLILVSVCWGLYKREKYLEAGILNLFLIMFCGFGLLYLITEMQPRYSYIICWIFIILALVPCRETFNY